MRYPFFAGLLHSSPELLASFCRPERVSRLAAQQLDGCWGAERDSVQQVLVSDRKPVAFGPAVLSCFMAAPAWAQSAKPNFTGEWRLDAAKSDFGQTPAPESITHVIDHQEPRIRIETRTTTEAGKGSSTQEFTTDGEPSVNRTRVMGGEHDVKVTGKWIERKLATAWSYAAQGMTIQFNDLWSVSEDGKVLTLVRTVQTPQGPMSVTTLYNKQ